MVEAAISGAVLAYVWEARAQRHFANGQLIECLASWRAPDDWLYLYYPARKHLSAGLRAIIEVLKVQE